MQQQQMMDLPIDDTLPTTFAAVKGEDWADEDEDAVDLADLSDDEEEEGFIRYNRAFVAKMSLTSDDLKAYYNVVKNTLLSYKGVKSRLSWTGDSYNKGRIRLAKINVRGHSLMVYLALDPSRYEGTKYRYRDVGFKKKYEYVPMLIKVRSRRGLRYAVELVADLMAANAIAQGAVPTQAYAPVRLTPEELMARDLMRVVGQGNEESQPDQEADAAHKTEQMAVQEVDEQPAVQEVESDVQAPSAAQPAIDVRLADVALSDSEAFAVLATESDLRRRRGHKKTMINIDVIGRAFSAGETVDLDALLARRLVPNGTGWVKVCARGMLDKPLVVKANDFSTVAIKMIVLTGGSAVKIK